MIETRKRVAGVNSAAHTYAPAGQDLPEGTLVGVTVTLAGGRTVLVGVESVDLDAGVVTSWWVSLGDGWVNGPSWPTVEQAVDVASDPDMIAALSEYRDVRRREWAARQEARDMAERAEQLLDDLAAPPCAGSGRRSRAVLAGGSRIARNAEKTYTCSCGHEATVTTDRNGWWQMPRHARKVASGDDDD